jgi:hypothetical protein
MSYLLTAAWIISTAQQANPKVKGHKDPARAHPINEDIREDNHSNFIKFKLWRDQLTYYINYVLTF